MTEPIEHPRTIPATAGGVVPQPDAPDPAARPRPGAGPPGRPSLGWTEIAVAVATWAVLTVGLSFVVILQSGPASLSDPSALPTFPLLIAGVVSFLGAALVAVAVRVRWLPAIGLRSTSWRWVLTGVGVGVLARVLAFGLVFGYMALTGDRSDPQEYMANTAAAGLGSLLLLILLGAVLTGFAEELAFRGVLYGALRRYGPLVAVVVSSVVFGLAHGINVVLPVAIVLGLLNAVMYERSGSIWPSVIAHAVHNALGFVFAAVLL